MMMSKLATLERLRKDLETLEARARDLRSQVVQALAKGDEKQADRWAGELERVERRLVLTREALASAQAEADRERARREAEEEARRAALATAYDAQNRQAAEVFAGLLLLALEALRRWQDLRTQAVAEAGRLPSPLDLRPRAEWQRGLEAILRALAPLLSDLSPSLPGDRLREHAWRAQVLEDLAENLAGPLKPLALEASRRERAAADRRPAPDRRALVQALSGRDRSGVSPLPSPALEVPRLRTGGS
jgi:hypothetical protein